jgi:aminoglycoside phosphotransferase (APT) family kinase protein
LTTPPWEPDRTLTAETATSLVHKRFPAIDARQLRHLGSGWEFDAYLTADGWVFRFPRRRESAQLFAFERTVHDLVADRLPAGLAIPRVEQLGEPVEPFPYPFAGHRFIPGLAADALDARQLPVLTPDIAAALAAIHSVSAETARAAGVTESNREDPGDQAWLESNLTVAPRLRGLDDRALDWLNRISLPLEHMPSPLQLIHQDLGPEHLLVDPATGHLLGVLDWTDATIGDAARDFVFLVTWQGWGFADDVIRHYPRPLDHGFRARLDLMARLLSLTWLANASQYQDDLSAHVNGVQNAFSNL